MPSDLIPYRTLYLNSLYSTGNASSFSFALPGSTFPSYDGKKYRFGLLQATVPGVYTNVNPLNNRIVFQEFDVVNDEVRKLTVELAVGTYTAATLATQLQTRMNAISLASGFNLTYTITNSSSQFLWSVAEADYQIFVLADDVNFTAGTLLGLSLETYEFDSVTGLVSPNTVNLINFFGPQEILIRCSNYTSRVYEAATGSESDLFAVCQNSIVIEDQNLVYSTQVPRIMIETQQAITRLHFTITDPQGNLLPGIAHPITMLIGAYLYNASD